MTNPFPNRPPRRPRIARWAVALLLPLSLAAAGCERLFFRPEPGNAEPPGLSEVGHRDVFFRSEDGVRLHGLLLFPKGTPRPGTILYLHGNAGNLSVQAGPAIWLAREGYRVFAFDYRGYGMSEGRPDIEGIHRDARAALALLPGLPGVDPDRIVVFGQSLGGSAAVCTVADAPERGRIRALVVNSAFAGYRRILRDKLAGLVVTWPFAWPASLFLDDRRSPERCIGRVSPIPVVVIHETADRVVPFRHGELLNERAKDPKGFWIVRGRGHVEALAEPQVRAQFLSFLESVFRDAGNDFPENSVKQ